MKVIFVAIAAAHGALLRAGASESSREDPVTKTYTKLGCFKNYTIGDLVVKDNHGLETPSKVEFEDWHMSIDKCFRFCKEHKDMNYFGITDTFCWCGYHYDGTKVEQTRTAKFKCDQVCRGDKKQTCGGVAASDIFYMYECMSTDTEMGPRRTQEAYDALRQKQHEDKLAYQKAQKFDSYVVHDKITCGQDEDAGASVDGKDTLVGSVEECKVTCWDSWQCAGFEYDREAQRCSFKGDTAAGERAANDKVGCFTKMIGRVEPKAASIEAAKK
eukprot:CAMPEP_0204274128 /NCGR_PEP_ID=MMETSP0468-20130131/25011_1 /ASSEMBLY_ACC=CAM_ASM_000383 /TAXON_ID=2969 /ORGANISM="Oxyrrhis marina" /LENGTH=271 /DNA_ID=CAMNT_0051250293 /DNA_START=99 /DNA_END=914 /DNA_ORIENTATION=-